MYKVKESIIVEGTYDKIKLSRFLDATIVPVGGFSVFKNKEKLEMIRRLAYETGIVIFTDSDSAGFKIRSYIKQGIPEQYVKHAYIPDIYGKEKRKREPGKEGLLGVEGIDEEILLDALIKAGCRIEGAPSLPKEREGITKADMYRLGLSGKNDSAKRRQMLLSELGLPKKLSPNMLLQVLNRLFTLEELSEIVQKNEDKKV